MEGLCFPCSCLWGQTCWSSLGNSHTNHMSTKSDHRPNCCRTTYQWHVCGWFVHRGRAWRGWEIQGKWNWRDSGVQWNHVQDYEERWSEVQSHADEWWAGWRKVEVTGWICSWNCLEQWNRQVFHLIECQCQQEEERRTHRAWPDCRHTLQVEGGQVDEKNLSLEHKPQLWSNWCAVSNHYQNEISNEEDVFQGVWSELGPRVAPGAWKTVDRDVYHDGWFCHWVW